MEEKLTLTPDELAEIAAIRAHLQKSIGSSLKENDEELIQQVIQDALARGYVSRDVFGLNHPV
jgi:hypothetical protein